MLSLGAELHFTENAVGRHGSDKFYKTIMSGNTIFTQYGRRGSRPPASLKRFATVDLAAAAMWKTLRDKVAKGYTVIDAAAFNLDDEFLGTYNAAYGDRDMATMVTRKWDRLQAGERSADRRSRLLRPDLQIRTPRTPLQGKFLLLDLIREDCPESTLYECVLADPSERFLPPMALSHPACTDEIRVAGWLNENAVAP